MTLQEDTKSQTRKLDLTEYQPSAPVELSVAQRDGLRLAVKDIGIEPALGEERTYVLRPHSTVGAVEIEGLSVVIHPKIPIRRVLSLVLYTLGARDIEQRSHFSFDEDVALPDLLASALASAAQHAFARGLLHGYRQDEESLFGVRGRIRFEDQIRRRHGRMLPVEVRWTRLVGQNQG